MRIACNFTQTILATHRGTWRREICVCVCVGGGCVYINRGSFICIYFKAKWYTYKTRHQSTLNEYLWPIFMKISLLNILSTASKSDISRHCKLMGRLSGNIFESVMVFKSLYHHSSPGFHDISLDDGNCLFISGICLNV